MLRAYKIALVSFVVALPLLMAPTGGIPSRPRFQAIGVNQAAGAAGTINGVAPSDWARLSQANIFTQSSTTNPAVLASSASPLIAMNETDGAANNRRYYIAAIAEQFRMGLHDDTPAVATDFLTVDRAGTTVDSINLQATTVQANGSIIATGRLASGRFTNNGAVCAVAADESKNISSCTRNGAGDVTVNFSAGTFDNTATCAVSHYFEGSANLRIFQVIGVSATAMQVRSYTTAGTITDAPFTIVCVGG